MLNEIYENVAKLIKTDTDYPDRNLMDWLHNQRVDQLTTEQLALQWYLMTIRNDLACPPRPKPSMKTKTN